jgi:hypothetical protein
VQQTTDGGYIIVGETRPYPSVVCDVYLIKTNSSGDALWTKTFGSAIDGTGYSVQQTTDGGYIIAGSISDGTGSNDVYLIKTNSSGDTLWTKTFGGTEWDNGFSVQQTTDGGYIVAGSTSSYGAGAYDVYLIKTDSNGDTLWTKTIGDINSNSGHCVQQTADGGYIVAGRYDAPDYNAYVYLVKLEPETGIEEETEGSPQFILESLGPNPFSSELSITCSIPEQARVELAVFDLSGRLVEELISDQLPVGSHTTIWSPSQDIPNGCYIVRLDACGRCEAARCLKLN